MDKLDTYLAALDSAAQEQASVGKQIVVLQKRYARLEETIATLLRLINDEDADPSSGVTEMGLTDTVRSVLKGTDEALTPVRVRDGLIKMGVNQADYTNLLASVHNILKRLVISNEVERVEAGEGTSYKWIKPRPRWFDRLVEAGVLDNPTKTTGPEEGEAKKLARELTDAAGVMPRQQKLGKLNILPRDQKTKEEPQRLPVMRDPQKVASENLPRFNAKKAEEAMKKKEDK